MKKLLWLAYLTIGFLAVNTSLASATVWTEDFNDISDWTAFEEATISSDGSVATVQNIINGGGGASREPGARILYETGDLISLTVTDIQSNPDTKWRLSIHQFNDGGTYVGEAILLDYLHATGTFSSDFSGHHVDLYDYVPCLRIYTIGMVGYAEFDELSVSQAPVPEPSSILLFGSALMGLLAVSRNRKTIIGSLKG